MLDLLIIALWMLAILGALDAWALVVLLAARFCGMNDELLQ